MSILNRTQLFTDIIHNTISYSGLEGIIISTPIFNRLHRILQSSLVYLTYSSNKVKRFEHSIGTMFLSGEIFYHSFINTEDESILDQLLQETKEKIRAWCESHSFLHDKLFDSSFASVISHENIFTYSIPKSCLYNSHLPNKVQGDDKYAYLVLFQAIRIVGLLHDVGHLPYSHVFEDATKILYDNVISLPNKTKAHNTFLTIMKDYYDNKKALHEEIGYQLLPQICVELEEELTQESDNYKLFVRIVFSFVEQILKANTAENDLFSDLHRIVSGIADADRLDYCTRDLFCSGLRKDIFPYERLLLNYKMAYLENEFKSEDGQNNDRKRLLFCPAIKNLAEIEELLSRRWTIFTQINYHHRVHKHEIIFSEIIANIALEELNSLGDKDIPNIETGVPLPLKVCSIWALVKMLQDNKRPIAYSIIQLDDSWMDTLLKNSFFEKYKKDYCDRKKFAGDYIWNMFDELISTKKHFFSYYKRSSNYIKFTKKLIDKWIYVVKDKTLDTTTKYVKEQLESSSSIISVKDLSLLLGIFLRNKKDFSYYQEVEKKLNDSLKQNDIGVVHCLFRQCGFNSGCYDVTSPVMFYGKDKELYDFKDISILIEHLKNLKDNYPPFHLYYLPSRTLNNTDLDKLEELLIDSMIKSFVL